MIKHNFEDIAVDKNLHLEEFLANVPVTPFETVDETDKDFYVHIHIYNEKVANEIFERSYGRQEEKQELERLRNCRKEFDTNLSEPEPVRRREVIGINCHVYTEEGMYTVAANLSDDEKRVLLNHIAEEIPESRQHVAYELSFIDARAAAKEIAPKKTTWGLEY